LTRDIVGQPKTTSEYIQATSRVGRDPRGPGFVITIFNWARPRDLSHYETFEHYHATFYTHVEALSVTPFAPRAVDRGLTALLVSLVRHADPTGIGAAWNPDPGAQHVPAEASSVEALTRRILQRAEYVEADPAIASRIEEAVRTRLGLWTQRQDAAARVGATLAYRGRGGAAEPLLHTPTPGGWTEWSTPNSLRETEASVNLLVDTYDGSIAGAGSYRMPERSTAPPTEAATVEDLDLTAEGEPLDADDDRGRAP
jgi:hypothetical protein